MEIVERRAKDGARSEGLGFLGANRGDGVVDAHAGVLGHQVGRADRRGSRDARETVNQDRVAPAAVPPNGLDGFRQAREHRAVVGADIAHGHADELDLRIFDETRDLVRRVDDQPDIVPRHEIGIAGVHGAADPESRLDFPGLVETDHGLDDAPSVRPQREKDEEDEEDGQQRIDHFLFILRRMFFSR